MRNALPAVFKMKEIFEMFAPGTVIKEPLVSKYITDIFTSFLLDSPENQTMGREVSEETISYINEHFKEEITTECLAEQVGLSPFHFIRTFKKETGFGFSEYVTLVRLQKAEYMLKNEPGKSICEVAYACGFNDSN